MHLGTDPGVVSTFCLCWLSIWEAWCSLLYTEFCTLPRPSSHVFVCVCVCMCRARLCVRLPDDSETDTLREYQAGQCESSYVRTELYGGEQTCRQQHARCSRKCRPIPLLRRCFLLLRWPRQALRVTVWRPSVRLSVPYFSNFNRARGAYLLWLTRGQHATRPGYSSARQYLFDTQRIPR